MQQPRWERLFATAVLGTSLATGAFASNPTEAAPDSPVPPVIRSLPWALGAELAEAAGMAPADSADENGWEDVQSGFRTRNGTILEVGGRTEFGWHDPHDQNGTFYLYWVQLDMGARLTEDISFQSTLSYEPSLDNAMVTPFGSTAGVSGTSVDGERIDVDEAYFQFDNALHHVGIPDPTHAFLIAGVKHHPQVGGIRGHLDARRQPLVTPTPTATQFYRDEDMGLWVGAHPFGWMEDVPLVGDLVTMVSFTNGNEIGLRGAGLAPNNSFVGGADPIRTLVIADRETDFDQSDTEELAAFVALPMDLAETANVEGLGTVTVSAFYRDSKLDGQEMLNVLGALGYLGTAVPEGSARERQRVGASAEWTAGSDNRCHFLFEWVDAVDSDLSRDSWTVETSYEVPLPGFEYRGHTFVTAIEPAFRFSQLNTDMSGIVRAVVGAAMGPGFTPPQFLVDREITSIGFNTTITENTELIVQYSFFNESGFSNAELDNDELMVSFRARV